ncbi:MAG: threonine/serine exporter family protein [Candidatus Eremiobacteraeota bacterium]|nr:threonine/serine exporter family protein [Candidatus Eremiobacteraeota bacterium]
MQNQAAVESPGIKASAAATREVLAGDAEAELVIALGRAYHQSGVPSDQLEELMHNAAAALQLELQVTALPTSITAAIGPGYAQKVVLLRLEPGAIDLQRLALLNAVYERVLHRNVVTSHAASEVERIAALSHDVGIVPTLIASCALSFGAAIILGGHAAEITAATTIGFTIGILALVGRRVPAVARLFEVLAALTATAIVTAYSRAAQHFEVYVPLVAGVVQLLPGLQLTTALHELAYRNLVAGTSRLGSVLMTLLSLGCGFALGIALVGPGALHVARIAYAPVPLYELALAVVAIASGIAVLQHARPSDYPWVLGSCAIAELAYRLFALLPGYQVSTFGAALVVGLLTSLGSRYARVPQAVLLVPGLLILVPGALSYESIIFVLQSNAADAAGIAVTSVVAAVEIVAGILLAQLFVAPPHGFRGARPAG